MPQLAPITIKDGANADVIYAPEGVVGGVATLLKSSGVPVGDQRLTYTSTRTPQGRRKVAMKLTIPVVQDVVMNGVTRPTVVRTAYADVTLSFDETSNTAERADCLARAKNVLGHATTVLVVSNLENLY